MRGRYLLAPQAQIQSVTVDDTETAYRFNRGELVVDTGSNPTSGALEISYRIDYPERPPEQPAHSEDPSYGVSASIQPEGTYLGGGTGWSPFTELETPYLLEVTAPAGYRAVTRGRFLESIDQDAATRTRWEIPARTGSLTLAAGPYQIHQDRRGQVPVYAFFGQKTVDLAATYLETAREYLEFYQQRFGPYPFPQFVIVENFFPTGYGFPGWTLLGSSVIRLPFIVNSSLVHEIAHCWWGNGVLPERSQGNWSEGLATYLADHLVKEREDPAEARDYRLKLLRDYATLSEGGGALRDFQFRHDRHSQVIGYGKGAMVFHMIRRRIGDEDFWAGLRLAAAKYMGKQASWGDLLKCFAAQGHPQLVKQFRPWLTRTDLPDLSLESVQVERSASGWSVSGRLVQHGPTWPLQVALRLNLAGGTELQQSLVTQEASIPFQFTTATRPLSLQADPESDLMRKLATVEIPATINHLRAADTLTVYSCEDLDPKPLETLLAALRKPPTGAIRFKALPRRLPAGAVLLYGSDCLEQLPVETGAGATAWLEEMRQLPAEQSMLAVLKRTDRDGVAAIFKPATTGEAANVARKIPHYGKYSALRFTGTRILDKQTWQPDAAPLLVPLTAGESSQP